MEILSTIAVLKIITDEISILSKWLNAVIRFAFFEGNKIVHKFQIAYFFLILHGLNRFFRFHLNNNNNDVGSIMIIMMLVQCFFFHSRNRSILYSIRHKLLCIMGNRLCVSGVVYSLSKSNHWKYFPVC